MIVYLIMGMNYNEGVNEDTAEVFTEFQRAHAYGEYLVESKEFDDYVFKQLST